MLKIFITLVVVGVLLYLLNTFFPIDGNIKKIINILAIVVVVVWLIKVLGLMSYLQGLN